jgi:type II secretory pathway component PulF
MSAATAEAVVERAASVAGAGMSLAAGLRAAAQEADSRELRQALSAVATELERGRSLDEVLSGRNIPRHLQGLIAAARQTGALSPLLAQWIENRRATRQHWRGVVAALTYPTIAVVMATLVFLLFAILIVPVFERMFDEFGLKLPLMTTMIIRACKAGSRIVLAVTGIGAISLIALRLIGGRAGWSLMISSLPLIGLTWHWTGVAEMLRCLGVFVEHQIPLSEALRLTADSSSDPFIGEQCRTLASRVDGGTSLTMAFIRLRTLPLSIAPLIHWGERHGTLAESLRSAAEMIEGRISMRSNVLIQIIPPILLVFVGAIAVTMTIGLFLPLVTVCYGLS